MSLVDWISDEDIERIVDHYVAKAGELPERVPESRWLNLGMEEPDPDPLSVDDAGMTALVKFFALLEEERPAWQRDALCLEYPDVTFFPEQGQSVQPAKDVCARCACQDECRAWAIATDARDGIWAGESARTLKRAKGAA